jgi:hypothetical protein
MAGLVLGRIERQRGDVPGLIVLRLGGRHFLWQPPHYLPDEVPCHRHHPFTGAEVFFQSNLGHGRVARLKSQDVVHITAAPLVDRLVIVTDHAYAGPQAVQLVDHRFLNRIDILVLVNDDMADACRQPRAQARIAGQFGHRLVQDAGVVEIALVVQQLPISWKLCNRRVAVQPLRRNGLVFAQDVE